jgi:hypothetical protein
VIWTESAEVITENAALPNRGEVQMLCDGRKLKEYKRSAKKLRSKRGELLSFMDRQLKKELIQNGKSAFV